MSLVSLVEQPNRKTKLPDIKSGDTIRVHQVIREGNKKRVQVFEGVVIRVRKQGQLTASITVRKVASGVGVEKSWMLHSPNITKVEVVRRAKVRRAYLTFLRQRRGKSARLTELGFDKAIANEADQRTAAQVEVDLAEGQTKSEGTKADAAQQDDASYDEVQSVEVVESTDDLAKEEAKAADEADPEKDADEIMEDASEDDALVAKEEVDEGIRRVEDKTTRQQDQNELQK